MTSYIRQRNAVVAAKAETTPGVDAWGGGAPAPATDFLRADIAIAFKQAQIPNPEMLGSLDEASPIPGGTSATITLTCMLRGSGTAGTPPQWGKLMPMCSFQETIGAAVAAELATAGTADSVTLGASYSAVAQAYRGVPAILTGNPVGPVSTLITDYTSGKVATLAQSFSPVLSATTDVAIPAYVLYSPTSDDTVIKSGTIVVYMDGLIWTFTGCSGSWKLDITAGGAGTLVFTMDGQYNAPVAVATPSGIVFDTPQPPIFRGGISRISSALARISKFSVDMGGQMFNPENPEAGEGFDPSVITSRKPVGSLDPLMNVTDTIARMAAFKSGSAQALAAQLGTVAGNQFGVVVPAAQYTGETPAARSGLMAETIPFYCTGIDAGILLSVF